LAIMAYIIPCTTGDSIASRVEIVVDDHRLFAYIENQ